MCIPVFPLKAIFYYNDNSIEDVWILNNIEDVSQNIEYHSAEDNKDESLKIFDAKNRRVYLRINERLEIQEFEIKKS